MNSPTDIIEHDGESFTISYTEFYTCGDCGHSWDDTVADDPDEDYRSEPPKNPSCPSCGATRGHTYIKQVDYYTKFHTIPLEDPPLEVEPHVAAIRHLANEFEALDANGWEMTQSDGVHIYFEKVEVESMDSGHEITDDLA